MMTGIVFISSVQGELAAERQEIFDIIQGEAILRQFFTSFLFEKLPAGDQRPDQIYLDKVGQCEIYLGIFGNEYGDDKNPEGLSPTEREFNRSTELGKYRIVLVKGNDDSSRHPKMLKLIRNAEQHLIRRRFSDVTDLTSKLYDALVEYLIHEGKIRTKPLDASACPDATIADIAPERVSWFLQKAKEERNFPLAVTTPPSAALTHLNLTDKEDPSCGAVLLFGKNPQKFFPVATIKCLSFHGTIVEKPIPSYQIYEGPLFNQVDLALDFVMSRINRSVIPSDKKPASDVRYEIPLKVVREAIVNAVAHRDYASNASVQVSVFSDRVEVRNPGSLPPGWTLDRLKSPHTSVPRYPLIIKPLFLARYAEQAGTGTLDMITLSREAGIPEPDFEQQGDEFVVTLWRTWLTESVMNDLGINERQRSAIRIVKEKGRVNSTEYSTIVNISRQTAFRDLTDLSKKGVLEKKGVTGKGTYYILSKRLRKVPHDSGTGEE
jgi:ATP-dependent DNA helicase RecG